MLEKMKTLKRLWKDEEAPTAVEYALMVAGIAVVIIAAVFFLGRTTSNAFTTVGNAVSNAVTNATTTTN